MRRLFLTGCLIALCAGPRPAAASSVLETLDVTELVPSPVPGHVIAPVIPMRWDARCTTIRFRMNNSQDPIPNPLGAPFLTIAAATPVLQAAAKAWTDIPTSYIELRVEGTYNDPGPTRLDQVNEITFRTDPTSFVVFERGIFSRAEGAPRVPTGTPPSNEAPIAFVRRTVLVADNEFLDGDDIDGDGDVDFSAGVATCQDLDGDGDIEFPAGLYKAGTFFDMDIQFVTGAQIGGAPYPGMRFTADPAQIDADPSSVDLYAVALKAFGLAHGVGHSMIDQRSDRDGRESVMFPFIDTADPDGERGVRALDVEAISTSSKHYPEGSASSGPAALQPGDVAFDAAYGIIAGEIRKGKQDQPISGASVYAIDHTTGEMVATALSGTSRWLPTPTGFGSVFLDPAFHIINGNYEIAVPPGVYEVGVEAIDDHPAGHRNFNVHALEAFALQIDQFNEDFYSGNQEGALERKPDDRGVVVIGAGERVDGIDIVINDVRDIANFGTFDARGFADVDPGTYYAVRFPIDQFLQTDQAVGGAILHGGAFLIALPKPSGLPQFGEALFTTGTLQPDGTARLDLNHPLARQRGFLGQDFDFTPFYFNDPVGLANRVRNGIARGSIKELFLVLRLPDDDDGNLPLIGLDGGVPGNDKPIFGLSYTSTDGRTFVPSGEFNYMFKLMLSEDSSGR